MTCQQNCGKKTHQKLLIGGRSRIGKIIAVTGGKGGVGKSVITSLMAVSLSKIGYRIGILDCDLYSPSISDIFGLGPGSISKNDEYTASSISGIKILSMGLLKNNFEQPLVWRSIASCTMLKEFWQITNWGDLDFLFLDLPNNSDLQLTVFQEFPLDGLILVTNQQRAVIQATKNVYELARGFNINTLGLVINMASFRCPSCQFKVGLRDELIAKRLMGLSQLPVLEVLSFDLSFLSICEEGKIELATTSAFQTIPGLLKTNELLC